MRGGVTAIGGIGAMIGVLVFIMVASNLIDPIVTAITDAAGLAVLGSVSGGSALILVIATVVVAGILLSVVRMFFPEAVERASSSVRRRRRF